MNTITKKEPRAGTRNSNVYPYRTTFKVAGKSQECKLNEKDLRDALIDVIGGLLIAVAMVFTIMLCWGGQH
jgi:hypothetical protein